MIVHWVLPSAGQSNDALNSPLEFVVAVMGGLACVTVIPLIVVDRFTNVTVWLVWAEPDGKTVFPVTVRAVILAALCQGGRPDSATQIVIHPAYNAIIEKVILPFSGQFGGGRHGGSVANVPGILRPARL